MTSLDLRNIASAGGNLVVNADKFTALDLKKHCFKWSWH